MGLKKHDVESQGAKPRDHAHVRHHFLKHAHRDWRIWLVAALMIALIVVYVLTGDLSWRPGNTTSQPMPANNAP
jgi:hypothetical protein